MRKTLAVACFLMVAALPLAGQARGGGDPPDFMSQALWTFQAHLSPSAEVGPILGTSGGEATVLVHTWRDAEGALVRAIVDYTVLVPVGELMVSALHIHRGAIGTNGAVVIGSGVGVMGPVRLGPGGRSLFDQADVDANGLAAIQAILDDPAGHYVNVHTPTNPPGEMRGQLHPSNHAGIARNGRDLYRLMDMVNSGSDFGGGGTIAHHRVVTRRPSPS